MTNPIALNFETNEIRMAGTGDNPLWVAADLCKVLEVINASQALERLDEDEKQTICLTYTSEAGNEVSFDALAVNESGLYSLILSSRKPVAKRLKKWVTSEVLPTIRKTGTYSIESDRQQLERQLLPAPTMKQIAECARTLKAAGISKAFIERVTLQNIKKHHPQLLPESPKPQEMSSLPTAKALLTPTKIAEELGWWCKSNPSKGDARLVNSELARLGYQESVGGRWSATDRAISAGLVDRKPVDTDSRTQKDQLLWSADILPILREHSPALITPTPQD